jgi:hypothetical protein
MAVVVLMTNGVFPSTGSDQAGPVAAGYFGVAGVLVVIALRAQRGSLDRAAAPKAAAAASLVIAESVTAAFMVVNNVFWPVVRQQHDKVVAFRASHWSDMRAFTNVSTLKEAAVLIPASIVGGAALGFCAGHLDRWLSRHPPTRPSPEWPGETGLPTTTTE